MLLHNSVSVYMFSYCCGLRPVHPVLCAQSSFWRLLVEWWSRDGDTCTDTTDNWRSAFGWITRDTTYNLQLAMVMLWDISHPMYTSFVGFSGCWTGHGLRKKISIWLDHQGHDLWSSFSDGVVLMVSCLSHALLITGWYGCTVMLWSSLVRLLEIVR